MTDMTPYRELAADIGCGDSDIMPRIFAMIADEDEARLMLAASPPATVEEIAEKSGLPLDRVEELIEPLFLKGLLFKSKKPEATRYCKVVGCTHWRPDPEFARTFVAPSRFAAEVGVDACTGCDVCVDRCFFKAISLGGPDERPVVDRDKCVGCGLCITACPDDAIVLEEIRPQDSIPA